MQKLCVARMDLSRIIHRMLTTELPATRTLTLVLPESDWRALREAEPDAVGWLQLQIRRRLTPSAGEGPSEPIGDSADTVFDDY